MDELQGSQVVQVHRGKAVTEAILQLNTYRFKRAALSELKQHVLSLSLLFPYSLLLMLISKLTYL